MKSLIANQQKSGKITLKPNERKRVPFSGSYIAIFTNDTTRDVIVSIDSGITNPVKAGTGYPTVKLSADRTSYEPAIFSYVDFINPADVDMTVEYILSLGQLNDTRSVVQGYLQMDLSAPRIETPVALSVSDSALTVLAADTSVKERLAQNTGANPVWWGGADIDPATGRGNVIYPGGSATINCWGEVYFQSEDGPSRISINEIKKVI